MHMYISASQGKKKASKKGADDTAAKAAEPEKPPPVSITLQPRREVDDWVYV